MKISASVITIDPQSQRFKDFQRHNAHLKYAIFKGILGRDISASDRIDRNLVTPEAANSGLVTDGRLGCALSHWSLWQQAAKTQSGMLIMEDDVITHPDLWKHILSLSDLDSTDMLYFGMNTDSITEVVTPEGLIKLSQFQPTYPDLKWIRSALSLTQIRNVRYSKLLKGFGNCCYFVSPKGAKTLIDSFFPLRMEGVPIRTVTPNMAGTGCDRRLNALFGSMQVFVADPFLAYTPNNESTTRPPHSKVILSRVTFAAASELLQLNWTCLAGHVARLAFAVTLSGGDAENSICKRACFNRSIFFAVWMRSLSMMNFAAASVIAALVAAGILGSFTICPRCSTA